MAAQISDALVGPLIGATIAALGYVGKVLVELFTGRRRLHAQRRAQLVQLRSLLYASRAAFLQQNKLAIQLAGQLQADGHPVELSKGTEWNLAQFHPMMSDEQLDAHKVIRGYTEHAILPLNKQMLDWLAADEYYRSGRVNTDDGQKLFNELHTLQAHLLLWVAKYEAWIPSDPAHALVFLADENKQGVGFPRGIEGLVDRVLGRPEPPTTSN